MTALWAVDVACSDPGCTEESEVILAELDDADWVVCECGYTMVAIAIAEFEPVSATRY